MQSHHAAPKTPLVDRVRNVKQNKSLLTFSSPEGVPGGLELQAASLYRQSARAESWTDHLWEPAVMADSCLKGTNCIEDTPPLSDSKN